MADKQANGERGLDERQEWDKMVSGAECFRKNNVRLLGGLRLLRFKVGKDRNCPLSFHERETPLRTLRIGRVAWALVRQDGEIADGQVPIVSDRNALVRARLALRRAFQAPLLFIAGLFVRRRKYAHFLMLGYNCEMAYRFIKANGFLDSTFFAWAGGLDGDGMVNALRHFDELFVGEMELAHGMRDVFRDVATGVKMHSHYNAQAFDLSKGESFDIEAAKEEVRSRAAYLRGKFYRQLRDDEPTLVLMKMMSRDCPDGDAKARAFVEQLRAMGGRNFDFLVVCQKADARHFPAEHPDYFLRTVSRYNPDVHAATEQFGDRFGWNMIWKEFCPVRKIVQNKTYKFDAKAGGNG